MRQDIETLRQGTPCLNVFLVRHGETLMNADGRIQGSCDSPLTSRGENEADKLGAFLKKQEKLQKIISSPTGRAFQTASIIAEHLGLKVDTDERLREIDMGDWEGRKFDEVAENDRSQLNAFLHRPAEFNKQGSEDFSAFLSRVKDFCEDIKRSEKGQNIAVVTHGAVILAFRLLATNVALNDFWRAGLVPHTSLSELKIGQNCRLISYGITPHLDIQDSPEVLNCNA